MDLLEIIYVDWVPLFSNEKRVLWGEGLYIQTERRLGVSDVGQVTISLFAVRGWRVINTVCFNSLRVCLHAEVALQKTALAPFQRL